MVSSFKDNLCIVSWTSGKYTSKLIESDEKDEEFDPITCFTLNPVSTNEAHSIVVSTKSGQIKSFNLQSKIFSRTIRAHNMSIQCMTFDPSGTLVATGSIDKSIKIWDIEKGHCTHIFRDNRDIIQNLYFHPSPEILRLFSSSDDNTVRLYDLRDSECIALFTEHMSKPTAMMVSEDGNILVTGGRDKVNCNNLYNLLI
jgi:U3 small nucleolar RNA-associated protein 13